MSKTKRIVGALGLALVLALGFAVVYAVAVAWGGSCWEAFVGHERGFNEHLVVTADGTPLIQRDTYNEYYQSNKTDYRTLRGNEVKVTSAEKQGWLADASLPIPRYRKEMFPIVGQQRIGRFSDAKGDPWYFIDDGARDGRGYFVGYSRENKRRLGFIGRSGFRPDQPPEDDWFPMDGVKLASNAAFAGRGHFYYWYDYEGNSTTGQFPKWKVEMISGSQLLQIDLLDRSVTTLIESPELSAAEILKARAPDKGPKHVGDEASPAGYLREYLAVRTADRVVLFDGLGKQHSAYLIPEELRDRGFSIYEVGKDAALLTYGVGHSKSPDTNVEKLVWIDAAGKTSQREEAELYAGHPRDEHREAWQGTGVVPSPIALAFVAAVIMPLEDMETVRQGYFARAAHHLAVFALPLLLVSLFSAVLAFLCWRRNRRYYQPASIVWLVFVLLTGLPGLVGYLFHRRWPVLEACPACERRVPRDRESCAACGKEFPTPPLKGIEVFA